MPTLAQPMRKDIVLGLSIAMMLAGFGLMVFGLLWGSEINLIFVVGGAAIAGLAGYLLIDELGRRDMN